MVTFPRPSQISCTMVISRCRNSFMHHEVSDLHIHAISQQHFQYFTMLMIMISETTLGDDLPYFPRNALTNGSLHHANMLAALTRPVCGFSVSMRTFTRTQIPRSLQGSQHISTYIETRQQRYIKERHGTHLIPSSPVREFPSDLDPCVRASYSSPITSKVHLVVSNAPSRLTDG